MSKRVRHTIRFFHHGELIGQSAFSVHSQNDIDQLVARGKRLAAEYKDIPESAIMYDIVDDEGNSVAEKAEAA